MPSAAERREVDVALVAASAAGLVAVSLLLVAAPAPGSSAARPAPAVARILRQTGAVLHRAGGTLVWDDAAPGEVLRAEDALYVPPGALATVAFERGASVDVEERSLVVLEAPAASDGLALVEGSVTGAAASRPVAVRGTRGTAVLDPGAEARVAWARGGRPAVDVYAGRAALDGVVSTAPPGAPRLESPPRRHHVWFGGAVPEVVLRWSGGREGLALQIASDPRFRRIVATAPGGAGEHAFRPAGPGTYWWRLADAAGAARSEARALDVQPDAPPLPFAPMRGEIVLAPKGREIAFWWTAVEGAPRYRVEVAGDREFRDLAWSGESDDPSLWADLGLAEGVYWWRVRAVAADRPDAPPSAPSPFRLVGTPVPDAPVLFDPSIEVERADR